VYAPELGRETDTQRDREREGAEINSNKYESD
jgi:hypothetical protein